MNKIDWGKSLKIIGIIAIIVIVFLYFNNKDQKRYQETDKIHLGISNISEALYELSSYAEDSQDYDEEDMRVSLYHLQEECYKLAQEAEKLYNSKYFDEPEYEENTRSWFY